MKFSKKGMVVVIAIMVFLAAPLLWSEGKQEKEVKELPPRPEFDSETIPEDQGKVKPVDQKPEEPMKIAVLGLENNPFWVPVKQGTLDAAEELEPYNCKVEWIVPPGDKHTADVFGKAIESAIVQEYDAIATIAGDSGIVPYINKAVEQGIPVATFNVETTEPNKRLFFVGADLYKQGVRAGEVMADLLDGKGKIAIITGFFSVEGHEQRRQGFLDAMEEKAPNVEIVGQVESGDKNDVAYNQTQDFLTANPDLDGLFVAAGGNIGAAKALVDAGKDDQVTMICYDYIPEAMEYVERGVIAGTIGQHPYAQGHDPAIRLYNYLVGGEVPPAGRLLTYSHFVTQENIDKYWNPDE
jgi:ribose transport system substrate-binding protein